MATAKIKFKIVTPEKAVFEQEVDQITLPIMDGEVTILPNHRSYIGALKAGEIMVKTEGKETHLAVSGGFVEFNDNKLAVLADTAERAEEIDVKRAEEAIKRAEELKQQRSTLDDLEYAKVAAAIEKENARLRVARRHHTRSGINLE